MTRNIRILLVNDDAGYARLVHCILNKSSVIHFEITQIRTLRDAIQKLRETSFEIILLSFDLPDSQGLTTFQDIQESWHEIPIVILADQRNASFALEAIGRGAQDFVIQDELDCEALIRTITYAIERHRFRSDLIAQRSLALFALDRLTFGVVLIGPLGTLIRTNRLAHAVLSEGDGLFMEGGFIRASTTQQNHSLQKLISEILNASEFSQRVCGGSLTINRGERQPLVLLITPLTLQSQSHKTRNNYLAIFISDPERTGKTIEDVLCRSHTLTKAEAHLACLILQGMSVADCSKKLGITVNTVRDHLKKIFLKTGTTRQADLVRLLLTSPPAAEE